MPQEEIKFERYNESSSLMEKEREKYERIGAQAKPHFILGDVEGFKGSSDKMCIEKNMWLVWDSQTQSCRCGSETYGKVLCNSYTNDLFVLDCNCLTLEQNTKTPVVGHCIFNCVNHTRYQVYNRAPSNCASLNRQGTLCGQCLDGYTVPAYSYTLKCIRCDRESENWGLYIVFAFLPLTVFIITTLVFRINVLSPHLNMFVLSAQLVSTPALVKIIFYYKKSYGIEILKKIVLTLYGIWNLDLFRIILPDVCIHAIPLHILVLDYLIAIYPMLLIALVYIFVQLHDCGFRLILFAWKPFHRFFVRFRRQWGIQTTIMDAFVTFFFLSSTKLLNVSFSLLVPTSLYTSEGKIHSVNLYYDPSIKYFIKEHLPCAIMAIIIFIFFIASPLSLLFFYQCKAYRKCLTKCQIRGSTLDEFVDTFQMYYKDGSNGTWDCRWFSGFYIFVKILSYFIYAIEPTGIFYILVGILFVIAASVVVIMEPYKEDYSVFNIIGSVLYLWQALFAASLVIVNHNIEVELSNSYIYASFVGLIPLVYLIGLVVNHLIKRRKKADGLVTSLPDRLLHPNMYRDSFGYVAIRQKELQDSQTSQ